MAALSLNQDCRRTHGQGRGLCRKGPSPQGRGSHQNERIFKVRRDSAASAQTDPLGNVTLGLHDMTG